MAIRQEFPPGRTRFFGDRGVLYFGSELVIWDNLLEGTELIV